MSQDRRQQPDRRILPTRPIKGGRRSTDQEPSHGTRIRYQRLGCRCLDCTAANRQYMASYRQAVRDGRPVLGTHVPGTEARKLLRALLEEGFLKAEIATFLGHRWPVLHWQHPEGVQLRTVLKLRLMHRRECT